MILWLFEILRPPKLTENRGLKISKRHKDPSATCHWCVNAVQDENSTSGFGPNPSKKKNIQLL